MADDRKIKEEVIQSESEKQEQMLRAEYNAKKKRERRRRIITWTVVILLVALVLLYVFKIRSDMQARIDAASQQSLTREVKVIENVYTATIDLSGYVEAFDLQEAMFRSTGAVTGVYVKEGDQVVKGQRLASIDNTSQTYQVQNLRNQLRQAELQGSTSSAEVLELQLENALKNLEYTDIVANFDGTVADVDVIEGDYFEAGSTTVLTVADLTKLKATVEIDEIDMQYIKLGQTAYLSFDSIPGEIIEAEVYYIPTLGTYSSSSGIGVVEVELLIDSPPQALRPGYSFEGTINAEGDVVMRLIPQAAVTTGRGGATTVERKKADGTTETVTVMVKYLGEGFCQVLSSNLQVGDTLVYTASSGSSLFPMMGGGGPGFGGPR